MRTRPSNKVLAVTVLVLSAALGLLWWLSPPSVAPPEAVPSATIPQPPDVAVQKTAPAPPASVPDPPSSAPVPVPVPPPTPSTEPPPPRPAAVARELRLQQPDAVWYGNAASGWRAIQRELLSEDVPPSVLAHVEGLVEDLRAARRDPDRVNLGAKRRLHRLTVEHLLRHHTPSPAIQDLLDRLEDHEAQLRQDLGR